MNVKLKEIFTKEKTMDPLLKKTTRQEIFDSISGSIYYLSGSGNDVTGDGTEGNPWRSLDYVQFVVEDGDGVVLQDGNYGSFDFVTIRAEQVTYIAEEGADVFFDNITLRENWDGFYYSLKLRFYGVKIAIDTDPGTVDPQDPNSDHDSYNKTIRPVELKSISDVEFYNCEVYNTRSKLLTTEGMHFWYVENIRVEGCNIHDTLSGIYFDTAIDCQFYYNNIHDLAETFIGDSGDSSNITIEGNHLHDRIWDKSDDYYPRLGEPYHGSGISVRSSNFTVRNNVIHNVGGTAAMMLYGDVTAPPEFNDILFEGNLCYDIQAYHAVRVYRLGSNIVFRNNTFIGRYRYLEDGFFVGRSQYNNVFVLHEISSGYDGSGLEMYNNIMVGEVDLDDALTTATFENNICWAVRSNWVYYKNIATNIIITDDYSTSDFFEKGFFKKFDATWPLMETYWDLQVAEDFPCSLGHGKVIDCSLLKDSKAVNYGSFLNAPSCGLGTLDKDGFVQINGNKREEEKCSVGCYEELKSIQPTGDYDSVDNLGDIKSKTIIGGVDPIKFAPNFNLSFHDDEFFININRAKKIAKDRDGIYEIGGIDTDIFYVDSNNRLKWDIRFDSLPSKMKFEWDLDYSPNVDFIYQDTLYNEWQKDDKGYGNFDDYENATSRPENIVGSYAVYGSKKGGSYKTGKLCHFLRPFVIDANSNSAWAEIEIKNKKLTIKLPQAFMDSATYPVTLDPNLGYDTIGGSSYLGNLLAIINSSPTATSSGNASEVFAYMRSGDGSSEQINLGFYEDNDDNTYPDNLISGPHTVTVSNTGPAWYSASITGSIASGEGYYAAVNTNANPATNTNYIYYDAGSAGDSAFDGSRTMPNPVSTTSWNDSWLYSIYLSYTESGGGGTLTGYGLSESDFLGSLVGIGSFSGLGQSLSDFLAGLKGIGSFSGLGQSVSDFLGAIKGIAGFSGTGQSVSDFLASINSGVSGALSGYGISESDFTAAITALMSSGGYGLSESDYLASIKAGGVLSGYGLSESDYNAVIRALGGVSLLENIYLNSLIGKNESLNSIITKNETIDGNLT